MPLPTWDTLDGPGRIAAAGALWFAVLLVLRVWAGTRGRQTRTGLATMLLVLTAVAAPFVLAFSDLRPWLRVAACLAMAAFSLFAASTQWTRPVLRWTGAAMLVGLGVVVYDIGRDVQGVPVAREIEATTTQLETLEDLARRRAQSDQATDLAEQDLRVALRAGPVPPAVERAGDRLVAVLSDQHLRPSGWLAPLEEVKRRLAEADFAGKAELGKAVQQLYDLRRAEWTKVSAGDVRAARDNVCRLARRAFPESPESYPCKDTSPATPPVATSKLPEAIAAMRLGLAQLRSDVVGGEEALKALAAARQDLVDAGRAEPAFSETLPQTVVSGASATVGTIPGQSEEGSVVLDVATWVVLLLVTLAGWRVLERRSGREMPGPVAVQFGAKPDAPAGTERQQAALRTALFKNVTEPAAAPGAAAASSLTDLSEVTAVVPQLRWLDAVLKAARSAFTAPSGYRAVVDYLPSPPGDPAAAATAAKSPTANAERHLLVRVLKVPGDELVAVREVAQDNEDETFRAAGYWVAGTVLGRSSRVPRWAAWTGDTAAALAAYDVRDQSLDLLAKAARRAPNSGLLLHKWADRLELDDLRADALELYCRAVAQYPDYLPARYRLAVGVATIAKNPTTYWDYLPFSQRLTVAKSLARAAKAMRLPSPLVPEELAAATDKQVTDKLKKLERETYDRLIIDTRWYHLAVRTFRRRERAIWLPEVGRSLAPNSPVNLWFWRAYSASLVHHDPTNATVKVDGPLKRFQGANVRRKRVEKRARKRGSWWQVSYNLACADATTSPDTALDWLERAAEHRGAREMTARWVRTDPDLEPLRGHPRFVRLLDRLNDEEGA